MSDQSDQRDIVRSVPRSVGAPSGHGACGDPAGPVASWCRCSTTTVPAPGGQVAVVRVVGEVDLCTVDVLRTALDSVVAQRPAWVIVDLGGLGFCSARGLTVLSQAGDVALGCGVGYVVAGVSAWLDRVWAMGWTAAQRPIGFPTAADAVLAASAHQIGAQDRARGDPQYLITARAAGADTAVPLSPLLPATAPIELTA